LMRVDKMFKNFNYRYLFLEKLYTQLNLWRLKYGILR